MPTRLLATIDPAGALTRARTATGREVLMDVEPPIGEGAGASPKEALLASLAGCTAADVASILRKKRQSARSYEIAVRAESARSHPRVFTSIVLEHRVTGDVDPEAVRRSVELSATKYCPVNAMLAGRVRIEHRYRLTTLEGAVHRGVVVVLGPGDEGPDR